MRSDGYESALVARAANVVGKYNDAKRKVVEAQEKSERAKQKTIKVLDEIVKDQPKVVATNGWVQHHLANTSGWCAADFARHFDQHGIERPEWCANTTYEKTPRPGRD